MNEYRTSEQHHVDTAKLYWRVTLPHVGSVVLDPGEKDDWLANCEEQPTKIEKIYLTDSEYEALPEFES